MAPRRILTNKKLLILKAVQENSGASTTKLAEITGIDQSSALRILAELVSRRLIQYKLKDPINRPTWLKYRRWYPVNPLNLQY